MEHARWQAEIESAQPFRFFLDTNRIMRNHFAQLGEHLIEPLCTIGDEVAELIKPIFSMKSTVPLEALLR